MLGLDGAGESGQTNKKAFVCLFVCCGGGGGGTFLSVRSGSVFGSG